MATCSNRTILLCGCLLLYGGSVAAWLTCTTLHVPGASEISGDFCLQVALDEAHVNVEAQLASYRLVAPPISVASLGTRMWHGLTIPVAFGTSLHLNISNVRVHLPPRTRFSGCLKANVRVLGYSVAEKDFACVDLHAARDGL
jgi:hypothetical protein